ncbi:MAG TPA: cob(I)yrinic acid a,c-diamide adenosyltransferase [Marinilabiliales bacterium]|nr:cob(I)yrinic acid a,c-diamide adenosyltransferase [Salinivirgaceae bacterium]OFX38107.1 MAG: ATP:cob(I)alamin adenosyltransferase [Bacteroidetes bacterium GWA2_40_14]OFX60285.1 MAG: ATP:cob(I)alamin adenosyltransferase [Bacteroidetes bacterium GWC2_40_13]OFX74230.1 MAG: ATP:cob(I)alamin adenosyltransferase [Bacteroidetes bacterium GWD2_40_43]OFX93267.1 MAG: ATP:cob(I)alamin adenosyltransferase [Bacteroidetes bacterium GWE2_40_63]OFY21603.1 MAG: ATP:cob(I)alamin adenosyltransferase [Bacteroi
MKIYTKTGDNGTTSLISGKRVPKYHLRIEAYGSIDELMAFNGLLYDQMTNETYRSFLLEVQDMLMTAASMLAADCDDCGFKLPKIVESDIQAIEKQIDQMELDLPPLAHFILPGGHVTVSQCHVARTVCRRCERLALRVHHEEAPCGLVVKYLNRLSDYYFVLSRKLAKDLKIDEITWKPRS